MNLSPQSAAVAQFKPGVTSVTQGYPEVDTWGTKASTEDITTWTSAGRSILSGVLFVLDVGCVKSKYEDRVRR